MFHQVVFPSTYSVDYLVGSQSRVGMWFREVIATRAFGHCARLEINERGQWPRRYELGILPSGQLIRAYRRAEPIILAYSQQDHSKQIKSKLSQDMSTVQCLRARQRHLGSQLRTSSPQFLNEGQISARGGLPLRQLASQKGTLLLFQLRRRLEHDFVREIFRHDKLVRLLLAGRRFRDAEPLEDRLDHLPEPEIVQEVQDQVRHDVRADQPGWHAVCSVALEAGDLGIGARAGLVHAQAAAADGLEDLRVDADGALERRRGGRPCLFQGNPHVPVHQDGLPAPPENTAAEEDRQEGHAVVPLGATTGHVDLVEEPVDIEEGAGELVQDEDRGIVVEERPL